ncbi:hypothetical protein PSKAS_02410 [Peribacillus sp. N1]
MNFIVAIKVFKRIPYCYIYLTRKFHTFTREVCSFTRKFYTFTREFRAITRKLLNFPHDQYIEIQFQFYLI